MERIFSKVLFRKLVESILIYHFAKIFKGYSMFCIYGAVRLQAMLSLDEPSLELNNTCSL